jgi:transposase-like protein
MSTSRDPLYRRHRFPPEVIGYAVWLYFRFPLSLRMVEEMLAARGICVTYETVRQWGTKFGKVFSDRIRERAPARGDKWHMDEVVVSIAGEPYWLWRAVDQNGFVLDVLVQRRRDSRAAQQLMRRLLKSAVTSPRVMITDKLRSYGAARAKMRLRVCRFTIKSRTSSISLIPNRPRLTSAALRASEPLPPGARSPKRMRLFDLFSQTNRAALAWSSLKLTMPPPPLV